MICPRAVFFDLDDTLAESFHPPASEMLDGLKKLLEHIPVAIITGASFERMESQFLPVLAASPRADRLYIFPGSSGKGFTYANGAWQCAYTVGLTGEDQERIVNTILETVSEFDILKNVPRYGQQMFKREEQVAFTLVGIDAPLEVKQTWDADGSKRKLFWETLKEKLPEFEILIGGMTTIDITRKGVSKAYGVTWLSQRLGIPASEMLYVGDALYPGGNDAVVIPTGIETRSVIGPAETQTIIDELLVACSA